VSILEFKLRHRPEKLKAPEPVWECLKCNSQHFQIRKSGAVACSTCGSVISNLVVNRREG
jgi:DNA-directed RNA polymerase subunit RPC12/RpoP